MSRHALPPSYDYSADRFMKEHTSAVTRASALCCASWERDTCSRLTHALAVLAACLATIRGVGPNGGSPSPAVCVVFQDKWALRPLLCELPPHASLTAGEDGDDTRSLRHIFVASPRDEPQSNAPPRRVRGRVKSTRFAPAEPSCWPWSKTPELGRSIPLEPSHQRTKAVRLAESQAEEESERSPRGAAARLLRLARLAQAGISTEGLFAIHFPNCVAFVVAPPLPEVSLLARSNSWEDSDAGVAKPAVDAETVNRLIAPARLDPAPAWLQDCDIRRFMGVKMEH